MKRVTGIQGTSESHYRLVCLFQWETGGAEGLGESLEKFIGKSDWGRNLNINFEDSDAGVVRFEVSGGLDAVDKAHGKLAAYSRKANILAKRLLDDVGMELRKRAYPRVAEVETKLRRFITAVTAENLGFDWAQMIGEADLWESVSALRQQTTDQSTIQQWIDFTQFDHLLKVVTADMAHLQEDEVLTVDMLREFLAEAESLAGLADTLTKKASKRTLWDEVFGPFFEDENEWEELQGALLEIVRFRHRVMHHRPVRKGYFEHMMERCEFVLQKIPVEPTLRDDQDLEAIRESAYELSDDFFRAYQRGQDSVQSLIDRGLLISVLGDTKKWERLTKNTALDSVLGDAEKLERLTKSSALDSALGDAEKWERLTKSSALGRAIRDARRSGILSEARDGYDPPATERSTAEEQTDSEQERIPDGLKLDNTDSNEGADD